MYEISPWDVEYTRRRHIPAARRGPFKKEEHKEKHSNPEWTAFFQSIKSMLRRS